MLLCCPQNNKVISIRGPSVYFKHQKNIYIYWIMFSIYENMSYTYMKVL